MNWPIVTAKDEVVNCKVVADVCGTEVLYLKNRLWVKVQIFSEWVRYWKGNISVCNEYM